MDSPQKVTFTVSARNLPRRTWARGEPFLRIWQRDGTYAGYTEVITNKYFIYNSDPDWLYVISFHWRKNAAQKLQVVAFDEDSKLKDCLIGWVTIDVDDLLIGRAGEILEPISDCHGTVHLKVTVPIRFSVTLEDLPKLSSSLGSCLCIEMYWGVEPHMELEKFHKTPIIEDSQNSSCNEVIVFEQYQPGTNQHFTFKIYKEHTVEGDEIGSVSFPIDAYVKTGAVSVYNLANEKESKDMGIIKITPIKLI